VSIPVPCNDDAIRSLQLILRPLVEAIEEGRADRTAEAPVQESPPPSTGREPTASATPQA
jgi:ribosomal protein S2